MAIRFVTCPTDWLMKLCSKTSKNGRLESDVQSRSGAQIVGSRDIAFEVLMVIEIEISNRQVTMHIRNKRWKFKWIYLRVMSIEVVIKISGKHEIVWKEIIEKKH